MHTHAKNLTPIPAPQASIFVQSHVSAHAELAWLLECTTPMGWLQRMIQFKEKARKQVRWNGGNRLVVCHCAM
jgi:tryptophanyl-tRNA synthetase